MVSDPKRRGHALTNHGGPSLVGLIAAIDKVGKSSEFGLETFRSRTIFPPGSLATCQLSLEARV